MTPATSEPKPVKEEPKPVVVEKPVETEKTGKISNRYIERLPKPKDDRTFWENKYKGYAYERVDARFNEYNQKWYVTAIMFKRS